MIKKVFELSTAHLPCSDPWFGFNTTFAKYPEGFIVLVQEIEYESHRPPWLRAIMAAALRENCSLINFDCDADVVDGFEVYDW